MIGTENIQRIHKVRRRITKAELLRNFRQRREFYKKVDGRKVKLSYDYIHQRVLRRYDCLKNEHSYANFLGVYRDFITKLIRILRIPVVETDVILHFDEIEDFQGFSRERISEPIYPVHRGFNSTSYRFQHKGTIQDITFHGDFEVLRDLHEAVNAYCARMAGEKLEEIEDEFGD
jgi:hypothetical protein